MDDTRRDDEPLEIGLDFTSLSTVAHLDSLSDLLLILLDPFVTTKDCSAHGLPYLTTMSARMELILAGVNA
jgi:hypothetical protein